MSNRRPGPPPLRRIDGRATSEYTTPTNLPVSVPGAWPSDFAYYPSPGDLQIRSVHPAHRKPADAGALKSKVSSRPPPAMPHQQAPATYLPSIPSRLRTRAAAMGASRLPLATKHLIVTSEPVAGTPPSAPSSSVSAGPWPDPYLLRREPPIPFATPGTYEAYAAREHVERGLPVDTPKREPPPPSHTSATLFITPKKRIEVTEDKDQGPTSPSVIMSSDKSSRMVDTDRRRVSHIPRPVPGIPVHTARPVPESILKKKSPTHLRSSNDEPLDRGVHKSSTSPDILTPRRPSTGISAVEATAQLQQITDRMQNVSLAANDKIIDIQNIAAAEALSSMSQPAKKQVKRVTFELVPEEVAVKRDVEIKRRVVDGVDETMKAQNARIKRLRDDISKTTMQMNKAQQWVEEDVVFRGRAAAIVKTEGRLLAREMRSRAPSPEVLEAHGAIMEGPPIQKTHLAPKLRAPAASLTYFPKAGAEEPEKNDPTFKSPYDAPFPTAIPQPESHTRPNPPHRRRYLFGGRLPVDRAPAISEQLQNKQLQDEQPQNKQLQDEQLQDVPLTPEPPDHDFVVVSAEDSEMREWCVINGEESEGVQGFPTDWQYGWVVKAAKMETEEGGQ